MLAILDQKSTTIKDFYWFWRGKGAIITQNLVVEYDIMKIHKKQHHQRLKKILLTTKFEKTIYSTQKQMKKKHFAYVDSLLKLLWDSFTINTNCVSKNLVKFVKIL